MDQFPVLYTIIGNGIIMHKTKHSNLEKFILEYSLEYVTMSYKEAKEISIPFKCVRKKTRYAQPLWKRI